MASSRRTAPPSTTTPITPALRTRCPSRISSDDLAQQSRLELVDLHTRVAKPGDGHQRAVCRCAGSCRWAATGDRRLGW